MMTAKQTEVIFRIGLLTVLVNVVSSKLLYTAEVLSQMPEYHGLKGKNGQGELLNYDIFNIMSVVPYVYNTELDAKNKLQSIRFDVVTSDSRTLSSNIRSGANKLCRGLPGIKSSPRPCKKVQSASYSCLLRMPSFKHDSDDDECTSTNAPTSQTYCYTGLSIDLPKHKKYGSRFLRLAVNFANTETMNSLRVEMLLFETPTIEEYIELHDKRVLALNGILPIEEFLDLTVDAREKNKGTLPIRRHIPWLKEVLDRAKYISSETLKSSGTQTDWYYTGATMMQSNTIPSFLTLDPRWQKYINNTPKNVS